MGLQCEIRVVHVVTTRIDEQQLAAPDGAASLFFSVYVARSDWFTLQSSAAFDVW